MTLDEFKSIYWWEWGHRQLGRADRRWSGRLGFLWFWLRRRIPPGWTPRLLGARRPRRAAGRDRLVDGRAPASPPGWSRSPRTGSPSISASPSCILGLIAWYVLRLGRPEAELLQARRQRNEGLIAWGTALVAVAFVQILLGALVAGIDAGRSYPDWPLMARRGLPPGRLRRSSPLWRNFLDNPGLVQFNHRLLGYLLFVLGLARLARAAARARSATSAAPSTR